MEQWKHVSLLLCTFGFLKELRPSEPFVTEYIIHFKNVTADEVIHVAFPVSTYTSLVVLPIVLLVTDFLRYRAVVQFEGLAYLTTWTVLYFGTNISAIIWVEIWYGIASASEVAYHTYIYAQVDSQHYAKVTSHTSSALYAGKFVGGIVAQFIISLHLSDYHHLVQLTLGFSGFAFILTLFLPSAQQQSVRLKSTNNDICGRMQRNLTQNAYSNSNVLKWSLWWALESAGQYQVVNYIQVLWEKLNEKELFEPYNGLIKAFHTLFSFIMCLVVGYIRVDWKKWGESLLAIISILQGVLLLIMANTSHLYIAYLCYLIFRTIHPVMLTIASSEVAQGISKDSHGLIFGINTFFALFIQTIITFVVTDKVGFAFDVQTQFLIYGLYFSLLGVLFIVVLCFLSISEM